MPKIQKSMSNGTDGVGGVFDEHSNSIDLIEGDEMETSGLMSLSLGGGGLGGGGGSLKVGSDTVRCFFVVDLGRATANNMSFFSNRTHYWICWEEQGTTLRTELA